MALELAVRSRRRGRRARRWGRRAIVGTLVLVVLAFALPSALGLARYTVPDDAMSGTLERGSVVFTESRPVPDLEIGDIITYAHPSQDGRGEPITRRIARIQDGLIWTRSDRTGEVDPWTITLEEAARARAVLDDPYPRYVYRELADGSGLLWRTMTGRR